MTCPVCGTPTVPGARFCFACGAALPAGAGSESEAERRLVTVLFGDLSDFTSWSEDLDPERVGVVTDRVLATLAGAVADFGGHVDKLTGDGLMAVFGAPTAHEDDAERAVRAAARMQSAVRRVVEEESGGGRRLGLRVGLNTGIVLAGIQAHLSYTVVGDTVNTASRLSDVAGIGAVFAGRDTALATMAIASWRALPPLRLKGKRELVPAYELVGLRPASASRLGLGDEAPIIGRNAESGLLIGRLLEVGDRAVPRGVLVTGDAGVGKTRLAQELSRFAGELPGARVLWGRCAPYGEGRDLAAVAEMVRTACAIGEADGIEAARERVARTVARLERPDRAGAVARTLTERLVALLGLEVETSGGDPDATVPEPLVGGEQVRQAVATLFTALAAEGLLVLVVDDLHWATPVMLKGLVDVVAQTRGGVLLLGVGRPDMLELPTQDLPGAWWERLPEVEILPLLPLEESATERLLGAYLGSPVGEVDASVRTALLSRAQGNPFFLAELLHLLVDRGALVREGERWVVVGEIPDGVLPAGVRAVLAARIDGLDGSAKGVLRDAAVLGLRVTVPGLVAVGRASGHGDPDVVQAAVCTLVERRLLEADSDEGSYHFGHTLVRDVAYAGLAKADRARRHAAAAQFAEAAQALGPGLAGSVEADAAAASQGERAVRLAVEMGLPPDDPAWAARDTAFAALVRLGRGALGRDDSAQAEQLFRRALALDSPVYGGVLPPSLVVPVRVGHAQALASLHRLDEAEQQLAPALDAFEQGVRAAALVVLGEVRRKRGHVMQARQAFVSALAAAASAGIDRLSGEALRQLGLLDYFDGRLRDAEERFRQAHALAVQVDDPRGAGWALQHLAWSATTRGDYALADSTLERATAVFSRLEDSGGLSWLAGTEGFVRLLQGRLSEARALVRSVLPLGEAIGERWGVAALLTIDALAAAELGDVGVAGVQAERARVTFGELGDAWGESLAATAQGAAARGADDPERAVALLGEAVELSGRSRYPVTGSLALVALGYAHLDQGDLEGAEAAAWRAAALLAGLDLDASAPLGAQVLLAQVLRSRGRLDEALAEIDAALSVPARPALLFPRRQALAHRAGVLLQLGRVDEALSTARTAVQTPTEDVRARVLALRALGSALRASGDPQAGRAALEQALEAARSTGQRSEIAATERLLAS
ncbi:MAG: adenylate/guanylate cyclase domain-containing protein [Mycobacteriales bacterium]